MLQEYFKDPLRVLQEMPYVCFNGTSSLLRVCLADALRMIHGCFYPKGSAYKVKVLRECFNFTFYASMTLRCINENSWQFHEDFKKLQGSTTFRHDIGYDIGHDIGPDISHDIGHEIGMTFDMT